MKRIILSSILFLFCATIICFAQDSTAVNNTSVANQAVEEYNNSMFNKTIAILEKEKDEQLAKGLESSKLYYNLGNAYFRADDIAKARLYYEKALLLNPGDRDTRHNIDYVSTKIEDKILVADNFFLSNWFRAIQNLYSSNGWAKGAIISFILFMISLTVFFFGRYMIVKKSAFYAGIVFLVLVICSNIFSFNQKRRIQNRDTAIIMTGSAPIYSSPDTNSKELFILHSGTKITINKEDRSWLEIEIDNGSIGWVQREKLEII